MAITSVTLHYFKFEGATPTIGLGENVNLFLKDSGIETTYLRHTHAEWATIKEDLIKKHNIAHPTMPYIEVDGKIFNKTAPTLRYLSKQLGKYQGSNDVENYQLDVASDIVRDHFSSMTPLFFSKDDEKVKEHYEKDTKKFLTAYERILATSGGPYILGERISYADFLVYHMIDDDVQNFTPTPVKEKGLVPAVKDEFPHVAKFLEAINQRPNLSGYFASLKN